VENSNKRCFFSPVFPRIAVPALAFLLTATGCATQRSKLSYQATVRRVESTLTPMVDKGIMPIDKETSSSETAFHFLEGSRFKKVDHMFPVRVSVTITSLKGGQAMDVAVVAKKHGLKLSRVNEEATHRWLKVVTRALQQP
jgi:hypothetical protein